MPIITIFSGSYCDAENIAERVSSELNYTLLDTETLYTHAVQQYSATQDKLKRAMYGPDSFFNNITHDKEKNIQYLKAVLTERIAEDNVVYHGFAAHLLPKEVSHILKVCIVAGWDFRFEKAMKQEKLSEKEVSRLLRTNDNDCIRWTHYLLEKSPWDNSLYDIVIPVHSYSLEKAVDIIVENARKDAVQSSPESQQTLHDYVLAAKAGALLAQKGHLVDVECAEGAVTILINKQVLRLEHHKNELVEIVQTLPGLKSVEAKIGPKYNLPNIGLKYDFELPSKILLVDDEVEFVHTLSERLQARSLASTIVYDGEEALNFVQEEEPEVMILDLKMPGIDGIEVLKNVKAEHPDVEVIILTGHGSEREEKVAKELGAFAYLKKPVDIDVLAKTMQDAYNKINAKKEAGAGEDT